jgi:hypothetical protein
MKNYPSFEYNPGETDAVYHEDREVAGVMYRAANANYNDLHNYWSQNDTSQASYATAQNTDGSISYLYMPPGTTGTWATWQGAGQPVTYYAVNYGLNIDDMSGGADNAAALQNAVTAAANGGGGRVFIAAGIYPIDGTINVPATVDGTDDTPPVGIIIEGCGGSTELVQQANPTFPAVFPIFSMTGSNKGRGVRFKNLRFTYANPQAGSYAIYSECDEVVCEGCTFQNCPAMYMAGAHNGLLDCSIFYDVDPSDATNNATMVYLGKANDFVDLCYIWQRPAYPNSKEEAGPTGCIAIQIIGISEPRVTNTNIAEFDYGINIAGNGGSTPNLLHGFFSNLTCECNVTAVTITPYDASYQIHQLFFTSCDFQRTENSPNTTPGVLIDVYEEGAADTVSDIFFSNCMSHDWAGPGVQIDGGQDITISSGRYGQNATAEIMSTSGAIAVTGAVVRLTIAAADCSAVIPVYDAQPPATNPQPYSISVTGEVTGMQVVACNLTDNGVGPLYAPTNGTDLRVADCSGYNDQVKQLTTTLPATATRFNGGTYGYFGPSTFYITGSAGAISAIKVSNSGSATAPAVTTGLLSGAFRLDPGEWGEIDHSVGVISFVLVGT